MDDFYITNDTFNFEFDPLAFSDLDSYNPFEGLPLLENPQFSATSPLPTQNSFFVNDVDSSPKIIQEHELRPYLEGLDVLWSPFTSPSSSQSTLTSSPDFADPSPFSSSSFAFPSPTYENPLAPLPHPVKLPTPSHESSLFSPEIITSNFDYGSPSSSSSGTVTNSPLLGKKRARTLSVKEEWEVEESSKRARTSSSDGPVHLVFLTAPQPAYSSTVASTSRLPIATPTQALCRCVFKKGNQKPARHWRTACPSNPARHNPNAKFRCEVEGCSMDFSRRDNRDRHMRKYH